MPGVRLEDTIVLDPSVQLEEIASDAPAAKRRGWLMLHHGLERAAVLPPGSGLRELVEGLREPTPVATLVDADDVANDAHVWQLVTNLVVMGFANVSQRPSAPPAPSLPRLVRVTTDEVTADLLAALRRMAGSKLEIVDAPGAELGALLDRLASSHERDGFAPHTLVIETRRPLDDGVLAAIRRLGGAVRLTGPLAVERVRAAVAAHLPVAVRIALDLEDADAVQAITALALAERITTLEIVLAWERWSAASDGAAIAAALYPRVEALADVLGDVRIAEFPADDEIAGACGREPSRPSTAVERAMRALHLQTRARYLAANEGRMTWGQNPDGDELWVPSEDDLLPHHPELLGLRAGAILVDVAGGFGRVARRLAPHVGASGLVISLDKEAIFSSRARRFTIDAGIRTIQYRVALGQRLPLPDACADAAVMEWGGAIHRHGLLARCVAEMARVVKPGGRVAVTYKLLNIVLEDLAETQPLYPKIYGALREAMQSDGVAIVTEKLWAVQPKLSGAPRVAFEERFLPRVLDDLRGRMLPHQPASADLMLTLVAERN